MSRIFPWQYSKSMRRPRILYFSFSLFIPLFVLPPHTREPRMVGQKISSFVRITPAYAGTTRIQLQALRQSQDHPRIRGNHPILTLLLIEQQGSPPHTREPHDNTAITIKFERITPAYAGTTQGGRIHPGQMEDHPRIRGNHWMMWSIPSSQRGSPPHTREPPTAITLSAVFARITPAYAGTTKNSIQQAPVVEDHPRIRGNHFVVVASVLAELGSPPHTREPHLHSGSHQRKLRITPAYAGTTTQSLSPNTQTEDHPRIRGNHKIEKKKIHLYVGSPPHTREPQILQRYCHERSRITPAYAGTT